MASGDYTFAVKLKKGANPDEIAKQHGFVHVKQVGDIEDTHLFEVHPEHREPSLMDEKLVSLEKSGNVEWTEKQVPHTRSKRRGGGGF
eukprot:CAMPEP_0177640616 /NCGR_PEP_ID=MMETSP0447-20121125/6636_1 /TAXON_ID=0 /ORGANISM="Stygamoeba regulata, Strain BSH-02190019" /LENGTH=87 /DNA_ID=CAMNT_0019142695 /DNA_START=41 /DNA_END=304 /DNA_ORIENTATION=+